MKTIFRILSSLFILLFFYTPTIGATVLDITEDDFVIGDKNAPITIIEYASLSCSHCANFHNNTLPDIKKEYVDTGKVRFVFRNFPYDPPSLIGSVILKCVPKDVRYDYMNVLFLLRKNWVISDNAKSTQELYKIMQSGGMSKEDFDNCLKRDDLADQIIKGRIDAQNEFNIQSTPSFLINGNLEQGNKSVKEFRQIIDKILSE